MQVKKVKLFIIVFCLLLLIFYIISNNIDSILGLLNRKKSASHEIAQETNNDIFKKHIVEEKDFEQINSLNEPYKVLSHIKVEDNKTTSVPEYSLDKDHINYRNYLQNVNFLIVKFFQDQDYTIQLHYIESILLPQEIKDILAYFNDYNKNYLINPNLGWVRVFPQNSYWIEKFIKIEKKSNFIKDKEKLRFSIIKRLDFLINFFYSEKLQQEFIKKL